MINYRAGSDEAPAGFPGMAHATEHMMFRGSPGLSADQLAAISAAFGAMTTPTHSSRHAVFLHYTRRNLKSHCALKPRGCMICCPTKNFGKERGAIKQEVAQDLSNPEYVFYEQLLAAVFKGTPYEHTRLALVIV